MLEELYEFNKVAVAFASCDHLKCMLHAVAGPEGFWDAELRLRQFIIGCQSCFADILHVVLSSNMRIETQHRDRGFNKGNFYYTFDIFYD